MGSVNYFKNHNILDILLLIQTRSRYPNLIVSYFDKKNKNLLLTL